GCGDTDGLDPTGLDLVRDLIEAAGGEVGRARQQGLDRLTAAGLRNIGDVGCGDPAEQRQLGDGQMVDRYGRAARPHEALRILLPRGDDIVDRVVRRVGGGDERIVVLDYTITQRRAV